MVLELRYGLVMGSQGLGQGHGAEEEEIGWEQKHVAEGHGDAETDIDWGRGT